MAVAELDRQYMEKVSLFFRSTRDPSRRPEGSLRQTALHFGLTRTKVQKILVTTGEYETPLTQTIQRLRKEGKSVREIAEALGVSSATVSSSLPYTTVFHGTAEPSAHTLAMRKYRAQRKNEDPFPAP